MNLEIFIDKNTCFYYWIQVASGWDSHAVDARTYHYYEGTLGKLSKKEKSALNDIKNILQNSEEVWWILADLYKGGVKSNKSNKIAQLSEQFREKFEGIWQQNSSHLGMWLTTLNSIDFARFSESMKNIVDFLDADFDLRDVYEVYLLQNPVFGEAGGHAINKTHFLLLHPPGSERPHKIDNLISVIAHEYIHAIEFKSKVSRELFKKSYDEYIGRYTVPTPDGYSWKMMYVEALVYCFASTTIGGYLRPEIYQKPRPTISEMQEGFQRLIKENRYNTNHIINWVALNVLSDVEEYIENGRKIDQKIVDKMSRVFLEFYLTD